jgi:prepilin peptidase CpaA
MQPSIDSYSIALLIGALTFAAISDIGYQRIPNLITYPAMVLGLFHHVATNGMEGFLIGMGGLAVGIVVLIPFYLMGGMGAGDVKLMGAVGSILGPKYAFISFVFTGIVGAIYSLLIMIINRRYGIDVIKRGLTTLKIFVLTKQFVAIHINKNEKKPKLYYALAISIGTLLCIFSELSKYSL